MGCSITKEKLESEILILQLTRSEIKQERNEILEKYKEVTGKELIRPKIPDYIDHKAMKKKKLIKMGKKLKKKQSTKCDEEDDDEEEESYSNSE